MKTHRVYHCDNGEVAEMVPAEVAQQLYDALEDLMNFGYFVPGHCASDAAQDKAREALAAADGDSHEDAQA